MIELLKLGGGIAGIIALAWRVVEFLKSYLQIDLDVDRESGSQEIYAITTIENKGPFAKTFAAAFLIVGPETEMPAETVNALRKLYPALDDFDTLNEMVTKIAQSVCRDNRFMMVGLSDDEGRAIIPLTYYYLENIRVGDERLTYSRSIDLSRFPQGTYAIRFYVEPKRRYYRSVQRLFTVHGTN